MEQHFQTYRQRILELWDRPHGNTMEGFGRFPYVGQRTGNTSAELTAVFIGMNPSYSRLHLQPHWEAVHHRHPALAHLSVEDLLAWTGPDDLSRQTRLLAAEDLDRHSRDNYPRYFGPVEALAVAGGLRAGQWMHLDLYPLRETSQKLLDAELKYPRRADLETFRKKGADSAYCKRRTWDPVLGELFDATVNLIRSLGPRIVVVLNSSASQLLESRLELQLQQNGHRYTTGKVPGAVWLLSSQLTGGATSVYGARRLVADLRDAVHGGSGLAGGAQTEAERAAEAAALTAANVIPTR